MQQPTDTTADIASSDMETPSDAGQPAAAPVVSPKDHLGVGTLVNESFSLLIRNAFKVIPVCAIPLSLAILPYYMLSSSFSKIGLSAPSLSNFGYLPALIVVLLGIGLALSLSAACISKMTANIKRQSSEPFWRQLAPALKATPSIFLTGVAACCVLALAQIAMAALISISQLFAVLTIPAIAALYLWFVAACCLIPAAAVIEKAGFGSAKRSIQLTKGYRLQVLLALFVASVSTILMQLGLSVVETLLTLVVTKFSFGAAVAIKVVTSISILALMIGFMVVVTTLLYLRLREIKEGGGLDQMEAVFE